MFASLFGMFGWYGLLVAPLCFVTIVKLVYLYAKNNPPTPEQIQFYKNHRKIGADYYSEFYKNIHTGEIVEI